MYESKAETKGEFYRMLRANNLGSEVLIGVAMADPDLVAFHELRLLNDTKAVGPKRAKLLDEYDRSTLFSEIQSTYGLSVYETEMAFRGIHEQVLQKRLEQEEL